MPKLTILMLLLLLPLKHAYSIPITELPGQLQTCMNSNECVVFNHAPVVTINGMEAYQYFDNLQGTPVSGYALRYALVGQSGEYLDSGYTGYGGHVWLTVQETYDLTLDSNLVTVYTDKVSPQPNNIFYGDSNGLDIDIILGNQALLSGDGFEYVGLDADLTSIYQANMNLQSDQGGSALLPCLAEGCLATADLHLIYLSYLQSGNTATLLFNSNDSRGLLYRVSSQYSETAENGGFSIAQSYTVTAVPLPASCWLFLSGMLGLIRLSRRNRIYG